MRKLPNLNVTPEGYWKFTVRVTQLPASHTVSTIALSGQGRCVTTSWHAPSIHSLAVALPFVQVT